MRKIYLMRMVLLAFAMIFTVSESFAQAENEKEPIKRNNVVFSIGHALIPTAEEAGEKKNMVTIPTWGLSYEYRFSHTFLLGLKGEIEISNYKIYDDEGTELQREYPFSLSLYAECRVVKGLYLFAGPGIEFENDEDLFIMSIGSFYEIELPGGWELIPEISYKLKGFHTSSYAIALGVCKVF